MPPFADPPKCANHTPKPNWGHWLLAAAQPTCPGKLHRPQESTKSWRLFYSSRDPPPPLPAAGQFMSWGAVEGANISAKEAKLSKTRSLICCWTRTTWPLTDVISRRAQPTSPQHIRHRHTDRLWHSFRPSNWLLILMKLSGWEVSSGCLMRHQLSEL